MNRTKLGVLGILIVIVYCFPAHAGEDEAFFEYKRINSAVYAIHSIERPKSAGEITLFRMAFDKRIDEPLLADEYSRRDFSTHPRSASPFVAMVPIGLTPGGAMPFLTELHHQNIPFAMLSHRLIDQRPFLFPVFERNGMQLRKGQAWNYDAPPFLLLESTVERIFNNEGKRVENIGLTTQIKSRWVRWDEVDGHKCAVIEFSFEVKPDEKLGEGKEEGEYSLSGTSWFSVDLGLPVMTKLKVDGYSIANNRPRRTFSFQRKTMLVHVERDATMVDAAANRSDNPQTLGEQKNAEQKVQDDIDVGVDKGEPVDEEIEEIDNFVDPAAAQVAPKGSNS